MILLNMPKDFVNIADIYVYVCVCVCVSGGEEWISTGLYLSPGMKTFLAIPAEIANKGWQVLYRKFQW